MKDRIEESIELAASAARVWQALVDYREFGEWFHVKVQAPFVPGQPAHGYLTYPGYENYPWEIMVQKMEPERLFSFTWHPYAVDPKHDYSQEIPTLVEFKLEKSKNGTRLLLTESGFDRIPTDRRLEAFHMNSKGWTTQMKNIENYIKTRP